MTVEEILKRIKRMASNALWFGLISGVLLGFALGFAIGYNHGIPQTVVVPLSEGFKI